jgi:signal transduction histidine kinase
MSGKLYLRHLLPAAIALATVTYGLVISTINTRNNLEESHEVAHSRDIVIALQDTLRHLLDLEVQNLQFSLSGDPSIIEPYRQAISNIDSHVETLTALTCSHPTHTRKLRTICDGIAILKDGLRLPPHNASPSALQTANASNAQAQRKQIHQFIDTMHADELSALRHKQRKLEESLEKTNLTIFVSNGIAIAAGILSTATLLLFLTTRDRENHLRAEKEKAENADRANSEFITMMSHEIRTPMNAILGFGELLNDSVQSPKEKHFTAAILSSGKSLLSLINDILDLSKIQASALPIQPEPVSLSQFADSIETLFSFQAAEKGLNFSVTIAPDTPEHLSFDALRLRQIIVNLVANSLKFTQLGSVSVNIRTLQNSENEITRLRIEVTDTGIGIPKHQLPAIFRPFYQVDSIQSRRYQGSGLGLSISRRLADAMQGEIFVASTLNKGSTFALEIPSTAPSNPPPPSEPAPTKPESTPTTPFTAPTLTPSRCIHLHAELSPLLESVWPDLAKLVPAQGTIRFSRQLAEIARSHDSKPLAAYAQSLADAAETMNLPEAGRLIQDFPNFVATIHSPHV